MGYEYVLRYKVIRLIEIDGQSILEKQVPALLPFTPLMRPSAGTDETRWLEKCIDAIALASVDQNTREILYAALGVFSGIVFEPELIYERLPEGIMQESPFIQYCLEKFSAEATQEAFNQGIEQGEKKGTIQNIITLLETQFQPDAVKVLKPNLESIDDMQRLRELLLVAPRVDNLETFMQYMSNGNVVESGNSGPPHS